MDNICRTCFTQNNEFISIYKNTQIKKMISLCIGLEISKLDLLSKKICNTCFNRLIEAYKFREMCWQSNDSFHKMFNEIYKPLAPSTTVEACTRNENLVEPLKDFDLILPEISVPEMHINEDFVEGSNNFQKVLYLTPPEICETTLDIVQEVLPSKSEKAYYAAFKKFDDWCSKKELSNPYSENILLTYFTEMKNQIGAKSSTMWSNYSMIRKILEIKHEIDISKYSKLRSYLKKINEGCTPEKSEFFTKQQFEKFISEAPDEKYLVTKLILIMGISGALRCEELIQINVEDVEDRDTLLWIKFQHNRSNIPRSFAISGDNLINIYRKYISLRPNFMPSRRLFIRYENGKCCRTVMGIHKIGNVPKEVALYLHLPNWKNYTGHCFRRTSAKLLLKEGNNTTKK